MSEVIQKITISELIVGELGITWEVSDPTRPLQFFVERAGSPDGPFVTLNSLAIVKAYGYIDRSYNDESVNRHIYYRIRAITPTETIFSKVIIFHNENPNYIGLALATLLVS